MKKQNYKSKLLLTVLALFTLTIFVNAQTVKPQFKGGKKALEKYFKKTPIISVLDAPDEANVVVRFQVGKTGLISSVTAINAVNEEVKNNAVKLVKSMPKWIPGKQDGVATAMWVTLNMVHFIPPVISEDPYIRDDDNVQLEIAAIERPESPKEVEERRTDAYKVVEQMPQYPGGQVEMLKFIGNNLKYPKVAVEYGIEGRVVVKFVVEKDGSISDIKVVRSLDSSCDKEAIRVIKEMPKWVPGKQNGHEVAVEYTLPVIFKLRKEK